MLNHDENIFILFFNFHFKWKKLRKKGEVQNIGYLKNEKRVWEIISCIHLEKVYVVNEMKKVFLWFLTKVKNIKQSLFANRFCFSTFYISFCIQPTFLLHVLLFLVLFVFSLFGAIVIPLMSLFLVFFL